jgi:hypothetical protein
LGTKYLGIDPLTLPQRQNFRCMWIKATDIQSCTECGEFKPRSAFSADNTHKRPSGMASQCRACRNKLRRKKYRENKYK